MGVQFVISVDNFRTRAIRQYCLDGTRVPSHRRVMQDSAPVSVARIDEIDVPSVGVQQLLDKVGVALREFMIENSHFPFPFYFSTGYK
jgi:hypothetical protein